MPDPMSDLPTIPAPVSHVNVWAVGEELVVTWRGGSDEVSVFVSEDPDDAGVEVRAPDQPGRAVLARTERRQYVHVFDPAHGFVVAAERRLEMDGPSNFRDLGGYPTLDDSTTRWGRVFRSDGLHELSDADHGRLRALDVTLVFDLRTEAEATAAPDRLPAGVDYVHLPMSSDVAQQRGLLERIQSGDLPKFDEDDMAEGYLRMLEGFGDHLSQVVTAVAEGHGVVFHCTAGKDRTGITAMTLLGLAGVADPHILDDYELSSRYRAAARDGTNWFADRIREAGYDPDDYHAMWGSPRPAMRKTLEAFRERWGDHDAYVRAIGVSDQVATEARRRLRAGG